MNTNDILALFDAQERRTAVPPMYIREESDGVVRHVSRFGLQDPGDFALHARGGHGHLRQTGLLGVADARQHVGDGI